MSPMTTTKAGLYAQLTKPFQEGAIYFYNPKTLSMGKIAYDEKD